MVSVLSTDDVCRVREVCLYFWRIVDQADETSVAADLKFAASAVLGVAKKLATAWLLSSVPATSRADAVKDLTVDHGLSSALLPGVAADKG